MSVLIFEQTLRRDLQAPGTAQCAQYLPEHLRLDIWEDLDQRCKISVEFCQHFFFAHSQGAFRFQILAGIL